MFLLQRIEEMTDTCSDARRTIGEFILAHKEDLLDYSITDVANAAYTSKASVVRFAKSLGYEGWKDFRRDFLVELRKEQDFASHIDVNYPFTKDDSGEEITAKLAVVSAVSIEETRQMIDWAVMNRIVNLMQRADRIVIFAVSPNTFVCDLFRRKMLTIGKYVQVCQPKEQGITVRSLTRSDFALIVSYSGNNPEIEPNRVVNFLKESRIPCAAITSAGQNYLHQSLENVLSISSHEHLYTKIGNFATEESLLYLLNILFALYFQRNYERNMKRKISGSKTLEPERIETEPLEL